MTAYNSQCDYILGEVLIPGRLPYTGGDTVLDLIQYAGGLLPTADQSRIRLIRSFPKGSPARVLPVNYEEIAMGTDSSTNYAILPYDRLVVPRLPLSRLEGDADRGASRDVENSSEVRAGRVAAAGLDRRAERSGYFNRKTPLPASDPNEELEKRIDELEKKLDRLIEVVEKSHPAPGEEPEAKPAAVLPEGDPRDLEPPPSAPMSLPPGQTIGRLERSPVAPGEEPRARPAAVLPDGNPFELERSPPASMERPPGRRMGGAAGRDRSNPRRGRMGMTGPPARRSPSGKPAESPPE